MTRLSPGYIILLLLSLGFAAGVWFLILPELSQLQQLRGEVSAITVTSNSVGSTSKDVTSSQTARAAERKTALLLIPTTDQQYDLAVQIESLSKTVGVSLTAMNMSVSSSNQAAATPTPTPSTLNVDQNITITLGVAGSYAQVVQFISELPTLDRYLTLTTVGVNGAASASPSTPNSGQLSATITALAYYAALPANLASK